MRWHEEYLGKPWVQNPNPPHSFNCGELVRHVYKRFLGHDSPMLLADTRDLRSCIKDIGNIFRYAPFKRVEMPQDFDIAIMARNELSRADHIGIYCDRNILHCRPKVGVFLDDAFTLASFGWRNIVYMRAEGLKPCLM